MGRAELEALRFWLSTEVEKRQKLGDYSQEARSIFNLFEVAYKLACHVKPDKAKKK